MATPDFDLRPAGGAPGPRRTAPSAPPRPPMPPTPPTAGSPTAGVRHEQRGRTINKTRNGGGFNPSFNPGLNINLVKNVNGGGNGAGQAASQGGPGTAGGRGSSDTPGSAFMSNEDIRAFAEHIRKEGRQRATLRSMDAEQLEAVLRTIPDLNGSIGGARMRARRVTRHLKRIAKAEQLIAREATALYATFEREYDSNARTVAKGRTTPPPRAAFNFR